MNRRVLLTGANGFVGRQVLRQLLQLGCEVRLLLRAANSVGNPQYSPQVSCIYTSDAFAESVDWWTKACEGVHTVLHLAWYVNPVDYLYSGNNLDCLVGTLRLAQGATLAGVKRLVGVGTCLEYDLSDPQVDLSVDVPLKPLTPYAGAKVAAFNALATWCASQKISFAWCRLFYLYGEGEDSRRLLPYVRARLTAGLRAELTTGQQIRDYLDVRLAGNLLALVALGDWQGPINVCSGQAITVRQLVENFAKPFNRSDLLAFGARADSMDVPPRVVGVPNKDLMTRLVDLVELESPSKVRFGKFADKA